MLSDPSSIFFQTELRFIPIEELGFGKTFIRNLYARLAEPGGYAYDNLSIQDGTPSMSTKRTTQHGVGESICRVNAHSISIEESQPEVDVDGFVQIIETVLKRVSESKDDCPSIFGQRCTIRCIAKPQECDHSIDLLAGRVSNVLNAIQPFERPPAYFGIRFRFPPVQFVNDNETESARTEERQDFVTLRFETWGKDVAQVWMEISATTFFKDAIGASDTGKIGDNIKDAYAFLTEKGIGFLNQFDKRDSKPGLRQ